MLVSHFYVIKQLLLSENCLSFQSQVYCCCVSRIPTLKNVLLINCQSCDFYQIWFALREKVQQEQHVFCNEIFVSFPSAFKPNYEDYLRRATKSSYVIMNTIYKDVGNHS